MTIASTDEWLNTLALAVAGGRSAASRARKHGTPVELAIERSALPESRGLEGAHRLRVAERTIGRFMACSEVAVDQVINALNYELSTIN